MKIGLSALYGPQSKTLQILHGMEYLQGMYHRLLEPDLAEMLTRNPVVGLLGPRQVGKTTLALAVEENRPSIYLDLESPSDLAKLAEPELFLRRHEGKLVILDEIQRVPGLFQVLRGLVDQGRRSGKGNGRFLVLGSAGIDLLQQSSESLAGRIAYTELPPLLLEETGAKTADPLWLRGGFPSSFTASDDAASLEWRRNFVRTYLERDIPQLGPRIPAETLRRLWVMLAHDQGGMVNAARLAAALGVSGQTVGRYIDLLCDLLLVRRLTPWASNAGKRMVKSPKVYVRDSGLVHVLLGINTLDDLLGHPVAGMSWEGWVIENLIAAAPTGTEAFCYRTSAGAEIDLVLELRPGKRWAFECKRSLTPTPARGFHEGCKDLTPERKLVIYPGTESYPLGQDVECVPLMEAVGMLRKL
jgi:predicted AAA+ superfamily ATPase